MDDDMSPLRSFMRWNADDVCFHLAIYRVFLTIALIGKPPTGAGGIGRG